VIGTRQRKTDGLAKSTGRARYTDDITLPGMLHGKILRSPHPHARILSVDTSAAEALPGVHATVVGSEMPIPFGIIVWTPDEHALATEKVRYIGDAVAAVAAVDEETANRALDLIRVEYEVLEPILDPREAARGPTCRSTSRRRPGTTATSPRWSSSSSARWSRGSPKSDVVIEGEYFFEGTTHTPIEPHCAIGLWEEGGAPAGTAHRLVVDPGAALPAPRARPRARAGPRQGAGHPAAGGRRVRREERAVRPRVLRREASP
jgi:4-hydroxybenzoyl-CoA reductase subunit alpha